MRSTRPSRSRPRARSSPNSGRSSAYAAPGQDPGRWRRQARVRGGPRPEVLVQDEIDRQRPVGEVVDRHQDGAGDPVSHGAKPLATEAVVIAHDQRRVGSDAFRDRLWLGLDRRSAREPDDLDGGGVKPGCQSVPQVAGHDGRPPAASHEPFGQRARTDEVSGADGHGRIGADDRVAFAHERSPAGGTTFWVTWRLIDTHDGWASTTASASRQPKSSRPIAS